MAKNWRDKSFRSIDSRLPEKLWESVLVLFRWHRESLVYRFGKVIGVGGLLQFLGSYYPESFGNFFEFEEPIQDLRFIIVFPLFQVPRVWENAPIVKPKEGIDRMSSNHQQGYITTRHPRPAGRVIDFRKANQEKNLPQTPQETVRITCGLCQFQFDRVAKPTFLILVCPSCGVRFEHHLPEPEPLPPKSYSEYFFSTPPKRLPTTPHQPLQQNLQHNLPAEVPEEEPVEEPPEINLPIPQVFTTVTTEEQDFQDLQDFDKEVQQSWSQYLQQYNQDTPPETRWVATLITAIQTALIVAALVALASGIHSYFQPVKQTPRGILGGAPENPPPVALWEPVEEKITERIAETVDSRPQSAPEPTKVATQRTADSWDLPLFDIDDSSIRQSQQKPPIPEDEAKLALSPPEAVETVEEVEIDVIQQIQLQAELAAKEKQLQALLREQGEIQTQSKRLVSETLLRESAITLEKNPTRSLFLSLQSIQILQELGLQVSDWGKTILAQAYSAQSVGEYFIEQAPTIEAQAICSQGKWLLTSHSDRTLWIWNLAQFDKGEQKGVGYQVDVCPVSVIDILLTPEEHWLVGARGDGLVELWDMTVDRPSEAKTVLREQIPGLCRVQVSPDGRWLVAYGRETQNQPGNHHVDRNSVWMWDMNTFKQGNTPRATVLRGHEGPIRCLAISSDSRWLATGSEDRSVRIFDLKSAYPGGNQKVLLGHQLEITDLQFAPDGRWIATGSRDNTARIWDLQSETATPTAKTLKGHNGWISSLAISTDGKWIATAGYDQSVRLWNTQAILVGIPEKESMTLVPGQGTIQKVAFTPDSGTLITYGTNQSLKIWNLAKESITDHVVEISCSISAFSFDANGRWLILSSNLGSQASVSLWPLKFEDMVRQATKFKDTALPTELHERENAYAKQFEQRIIR